MTVRLEVTGGMAVDPPRPVPRPLPVVGHALQLLFRPRRFLRSLRGCGDIVEIRLAGTPAYLICAPELVWEMVTDHGDVFIKGGPKTETFRTVFGNGIVASNGPFHTRQRRMVRPVFERSRIAVSCDEFAAVAAAAADSWDEAREIDAVHEMKAVAGMALARTIFAGSPDVDALTDITRSIPILVDGIGRRMVAPLAPLYKLPTPQNRRYESANARMHTLTDRIIDEYRNTSEVREDMLAMLLDAKDEETGEAMSDQEIHDEVLNIIVAGFETVATMSAWILYLIARRPAIQDRVHAEVERVVDGRPPRFADVAAMHYVRCLTEEAMRVYPPVWLVIRTSTAPTTLGDAAIPSGATVLFSPYMLHHDPRTFPDPDVVDPDRWQAGSRPNTRGAYVPFGAGSRRCIGSAFAMAEIAVILATIVTRWHIQLIPGTTVRPIVTGTYHPGNLSLTLAARRS